MQLQAEGANTLLELGFDPVNPELRALAGLMLKHCGGGG